MRSAVYFGLGLAALVLSAGGGHAQSQRALQEQYCTGDAFRLCSSEIPDEARIELCMARQRQLLSPACRAVFDDPVPVARAKPGKPVQLRSN